jgi:hypothetical protein
MPTPRRGRGDIESLPSGSFRAVVPAGMDPLTGRRRALRETAGTRREAEKALTRMGAAVGSSRPSRADHSVRRPGVGKCDRSLRPETRPLTLLSRPVPGSLLSRATALVP